MQASRQSTRTLDVGLVALTAVAINGAVSSCICNTTKGTITIAVASGGSATVGTLYGNIPLTNNRIGPDSILSCMVSCDTSGAALGIGSVTCTNGSASIKLIQLSATSPGTGNIRIDFFVLNPVGGR